MTRQATGKTPRANSSLARSPKFEANTNDSFSLKLMKLKSDEESKALKTPKSTAKTPRGGKKKAKGAKKKKIRHDVIYKTILRECRRFYQEKLNHITGFITSKKVRKDDHMYKCFEKFNQSYLNLDGTFEENFYLAALVYPQDLIRNANMFLERRSDKTSDASKKKYVASVNRIHDTLYKYSHEKLDYFSSIPELSLLF